jgi:BirA family biotin operon repressor/biotin-[acetyl-CoA-carboxylase] ligase
MNAADPILAILYDRTEGYCLLDELAAACGSTPQRVEGILRDLADRGHRLEFSPASGVRLGRPVRLEASLIERGLNARRIGRNVICFEEVNSTNDVAFDSSRQGGADGLVVLAESQRAGRGRHGRRWASPPGSGILMSALLMDPHRRLAHEPLTIAAGLATAQGIADACGLQPQLKWPNDVLLDGAKLAGILVEVRGKGASRAVVVGIGINANGAPPPADTGRPAACLAESLGHPVERIEVVRAVLARLDEWVQRLSPAGRPAPAQLAALHHEWMQRCGMLNERITVTCAGVPYSGRVLDVSPLDGLVLALDSGRQVTLPAETSSLQQA